MDSSRRTAFIASLRRSTQQAGGQRVGRLTDTASPFRTRNTTPKISSASSVCVPAPMRYCLFQPSMIQVYEHLSCGSTNRRRLKVDKFLDLEIPIPLDIDTQIEIADRFMDAERLIKELIDRFGGMGDELNDLVSSALHNVFSANSRDSALS